MGARIRFVGVGKNIPANQTNKHRKAHEVFASELIRVSDIVIEVLDARFIEESRNLKIEQDILDKGKKLIYAVNKVDLVDVKELLASNKLQNLRPYVLISSKNHTGKKRLRDMIKIQVKRLRKENSILMKQVKDEQIRLSNEKKETIIKMDRRAHVGIIGYPNTGKSTLINSLASGGAANAAPDAGFTKGVQKIRFTKDILILDSPGIIPAEENLFPNSTDLRKHVIIGAKNSDKTKEPEFVVNEIMKAYPGKLEKYYNIDVLEDLEYLLNTLGRRWGFVLKGNVANVDKVSRRILKDWQEGNIR